AYNQHPMITFVPTLSKKILPRTRFVTLVESHYGADPRGVYNGTACVGSCSRLDRALYRSLARWIGLPPLDFAGPYREGELGTLLRYSDHLIVVSERVRDLLMRRCAKVAEKSTVIPAPPLVRILSDERGQVRQTWRATLGIAQDEFVLAYFGYMYPGKGV